MLVIGGGITGAGVALDAASRGLSTALVERDDFASGTSSKSSKLVHGGLRYLQHREFKLVYENLYERQIALRNAPHLVRILPFLIPVLSKDGLMNAKLARALGSALWLYDFTGGLRIGKLHRRIKKEAAVAHMPTLRVAERRRRVHLLRRADRRRPAHADDRPHRGDARRGRSRTTPASPACARTRRAAIIGATVEADGETIDVDAKFVVNATGVWSDDIRAFDEAGAPAHDPAGQGHPHHGAVEQGPQRHRGDRAGAEGQALDLRGAVGRLHLHRHDRHGLRRPARRSRVHPRGHRLPARRDEPRDDGAADQGRHRRHLGRAAAVDRGRQRRREDGGPLPRAQGAHVAERARHGHRRQAHDLPADGLGHRRRDRRHPRPRRQVRDEEAAAARRHRVAGLGHGARARRRATSTWPAGTAACSARSWTSSATTPT